MLDFRQREKEILDFWDKHKSFEKSVSKESPQGDYLFYDGPPFATGTPHYGHLVGSIMKDVVPRYFTMKGYRVERRWGWDCHGLPVENIVEKDLGFKSKKDIEKHGIDKFNENCRACVLEYVDIWKHTIRRLGRWVDMENDYKTMDLSYMESIWWVFKTLWDKGLVYEDYRSMHICPRCETTLSQSEVAEGYKDVKDLSLIAKFELLEKPSTYLLAWTTTPWTLIGNVALAVGNDIDYLEVDISDNFDPVKFGLDNFDISPGKYIFAKEAANKGDKRLHQLLHLALLQKAKSFKGKDLIGKKYKALFDYYSADEKLTNRENGWQIYPGDFVTTEEGTGIVHIAPAFGEDDMNLGKVYNLPFVQHVAMDGTINKEVKDFAGLNVKPKDDYSATDVEILKYLDKKGLYFSKEKYEHSYPHCWRCETPLLNYATSSWFVSVTKIKDKLLKNAKKINWIPDHIKEGRFGNWLEGARDWSISRQRFWGSVIPLWVCDQCEYKVVVGSVEELYNLSNQKIDDLHKHIVDKITFACSQNSCQGTMKRIPDVLDCWFESGSMPYAQSHYPFENEFDFDKKFPAKFIAEGADQTRTWFYYLHVIAGGVKNSQAFENCIVNGIVLAEDGKKMSKRLQNYPEPDEVMEKYGADALRMYLLNSPVMLAENLSFTERDLQTVYRRFIALLQNVYNFYEMFRGDEKLSGQQPKKFNNDLDKWIVSKLYLLHQEVSQAMDAYNLVKASRPLIDFVDALSTWYVRRSRDRFKSDDESDRTEAIETLGFVLKEFAKIIAPFTPMTAEIIYQGFINDKESVHLENWPVLNKNLLDKDVLDKMEIARQIAEKMHAIRAQEGIKVRQILLDLNIEKKSGLDEKKDEQILGILKDEINLEQVNVVGKVSAGEGWRSVEVAGANASMYIKITDDLKEKGIVRELVRAINSLRKEAGLKPQDRPIETYQTDSDYLKNLIVKFKDQLINATSAGDLIEQAEAVKISKEIEIEGAKIILGLKF